MVLIRMINQNNGYWTVLTQESLLNVVTVYLLIERDEQCYT